MQNSVVVFTFSVLDQKYPFWSNLFRKIIIVSLSWNVEPKLIRICRIQWWCSLFLVLKLIRICRIQWWCSLFSVLDGKHPFWANLVQKIKTVSLSWNLAPRLIWIWRIQWRCLLFCFRSEKLFLGKFGPNNQNCQFQLKFGT